MQQNDIIEAIRKLIYQSNYDGRVVIDGLFADFAVQTATQISQLSGADADTNAFLADLKVLLDSEPGTPGYQAGQNIPALIASKYADAINASDVAAAAAAAAASVANAVQTQLTALAAQVSAVDADLQAFKGQTSLQFDSAQADYIARDAVLAASIATNTQGISALNTAVTDEAAQRVSGDAANAAAAASAQTKADSLEAALVALVTDVNTGSSAFLEAARGWRKMPSAFGTAYTPPVFTTEPALTALIQINMGSLAIQGTSDGQTIVYGVQDSGVTYTIPVQAGGVFGAWLAPEFVPGALVNVTVFNATGSKTIVVAVPV